MKVYTVVATLITDQACAASERATLLREIVNTELQHRVCSSLDVARALCNNCVAGLNWQPTEAQEDFAYTWTEVADVGELEILIEPEEVLDTVLTD